MMQRRSGRKEALDLLCRGRNPTERERLAGLNELIAHYRDEAAHGGNATRDEPDAHMAKVALLRLAMFATERWATLTAREARDAGPHRVRDGAEPA